MDKTAYSELEGAMQARRQVFAVLSRLLGKEVDQELLDMLKGEGVLQTDDEELTPGIERMNEYLASEDASKLDLDRDYAKAFCGAGSTNRDSAYPFESFYTSKERLLMQEARDDAVRWYRRWGLEKDEAWHDCEDHVGVELEFMVDLIDLWQEAVAAGDADRAHEVLAAQRDFERDHLANWLPLFAADAQNRCRTGFYQGLTRLTSDFVHQDVAALDDLLA